MITEYLRVRKNVDSTEYFDLLLSHEVEINSFHSTYLIEFIPLTRTTNCEGHIYVDDISLNDQRFSFDLELSHSDKSAKFASRKHIMVPSQLKGCGLGSYAISKLIRWGQDMHPDYQVSKLTLSTADAQTNEARDQRNRFYRKHHFVMDFASDPVEEREGSCSAPSLKQLSASNISNKVSALNLQREISSLQINHANLKRDSAQKGTAIDRYKQLNQVLIEKNAKITLFEVVAIISTISLAVLTFKIVFVG